MLPTSQTKSIKDGINEQLLSNDKALLYETKLQMMEHLRKYHLNIKTRDAKSVKQMTFHRGDWVFKRAVWNLEHGKLDTNWNGPYVIVAIYSEHAYFL